MRWTRQGSGRHAWYYARTEAHGYYVGRDSKGWILEIRNVTTTAGVKHTVGQPVIDETLADLKGDAQAIAAEYEALGDDYKPHEHGYQERLTQAIGIAYDKLRRNLGMPRGAAAQEVLYARRLARLEREIRNSHGTAQSSITSRREHPSYGYTKTMIRDEISRLSALIEAWMLVTGGFTDGGRPLSTLIDEAAKAKFGYDLTALRKEWL